MFLDVQACMEITDVPSTFFGLMMGRMGRGSSRGGHFDCMENLASLSSVHLYQPMSGEKIGLFYEIISRGFDSYTMPTQIQTYMVDYRLDSYLDDDLLRALVIQPLQKVFKSKLIEISVRHRPQDFSKSFCLEGDEIDVSIWIKLYNKHLPKDQHVLLTLTVELPREIEESIILEDGFSLEEALKTSLTTNFPETSGSFFPAIKRTLKDSPYLRSSDNRLMEYKYEKVLFSDQSPYQFVQIVQTLDFGPLLILDGYANYAESDKETYTHMLMNLPHEDYSGKEVLILGGGDGALIQELFALENPPSFVTMVDIDAMVMDACNQFMPNVCGKFLDRSNWEGPNHKIIAGDAIAFMKECLSGPKKFDFIFGDLTDTPVSTTPRDESVWAFLKMILDMGVNLLKPNTGKYLTHCNGICVPQSLEAYEKVLANLAGGSCTFTKTTRYVNSFYETWTYYQIIRNEK
ncbi:hypothetical protein TCAL_04573 [Tigriopus californicus]|uniref:PABS domain-containing protein n=1 Tax=Tigriopus californicus TaxID=6832 RepID=A0A553NT49_TIGCA|nr:spermine synthase-like [Tigriopus californicus]TRY68607.1 hypothetical protein TCAL_04573 [Tigriopus californicus]